MTGFIQGALWYAGSGAVALAIIRWASWLRQRNEKDSFVSDLIRSAQPPRSRPSLIIRILEDAGVWLFALAIWPFAVAIVGWDWISAFRRRRWVRGEVDPEERFYAKGNLLEEISIATAESRERYVDPLGLVPALPFGHLHDGWQSFLTHKPSFDATLWAFHRKTDDKKGWSFDRANGTARGYCWVVGGKVVAEIVVES